ncbi:MAG: AAA family ATPase [Tuberibacillus sp.]
MRPIELTVKGLHSFRERQTVDFAGLCDGGVFGIFGPTGSGKSSLLDAMTLALYGKVERAGAGTQGILNHAEDELSVTFTFELGIDHPERYRVERVYKRSKTDGLNIGSCRLLRFENGESEVLADKERDVTHQVTNILGLNLDDFTRAVVLPQGKFAEFLSLKGVDRRRMLQRLFNMEKYGDRLNNAIRKRAYQAENKLDIIRSAQLELGDASKEAVDAAKKAYHEWDEQVARLTEEYRNAKSSFEKAKLQRDLQVSLQLALEQEQDLMKRSPEIKTFEIMAKRAKQANNLLPYVTDYEAITVQLRELREEKDQAANAFQDCCVQEETKKKAFEAVSFQVKDGAHEYEKRRESLRQAVQIYQNLENKRMETAQLKAELGQYQSKLQEKRLHHKTLNEKRDHWLNEREQIRANLKKVAVTAEERERILNALTDKQAIENKLTAFVDLREQWQDLQSKKKMATSGFNEEKQKLDKTIDHLRFLFTRYEACYHHVSGLKKGLDTVLDWLVQKEADGEKRIQNATIEHLAAELAKKLQDGKPCPVCGAIHHPEPANSQTNNQLTKLKEAMQLYKQCSQWISSAIHSCSANQALLEQRVNQMKETDIALIPQITGRKEETLVPDLSSWTEEDLKAWITQTNADIHAVKQDILELDEKFKPHMESYNKHSSQSLILETQMKEMERQNEVITEKLKTLKKDIDQDRQKWSESYAGMDYPTVESEQQRVHSFDRKAHEWNSRVDGLNQEIEGLEKGLRLLESEISDLQQTDARLDEKLKEAEKQIESLMSDYQKIMGDETETASQVLQKLENAWARLNAELSEKQMEWEKAKAERFDCEKRLSNLEELLKSTNKQAEEKSVALLDQLKRHAFPSPQAVKEACLPDEIIAEKEEMILQFEKNLSQVQHQIEELKSQLGDDVPSDEEYASMEQAFLNLGHKRDQALEARATALNEWENVTERHERFIQLEKERKEWAELESHLQKLSSVFRGNGFVEYMAEEQMEQISRDASDRLRKLTRGRYAIEVDSGGGFIIRDDANGGMRRPVSSLSGGETFLTSLALALSLSTQIQLRGEVPLQFFFLDEGFGTLDQELLDTVITALEKLHSERMSIGVISHVPELQDRLAHKLFVEPAEPSGRGSRLIHSVM